MQKSVAIIGKGPSVLKSKKEFVDSFDEVAICNWPPFIGYEQYIGSRATYHFLNAGNPYFYKKDLLDSLGLKKFFNTQAHFEGGGPVIKELPESILPSHGVEYQWDFGLITRKKYEDKYGVWPSTGIMALDYFLNCDEFQTIALIGFDFYGVGDDVYYFPKEIAKDNLHYLWDNGTYTTDGKNTEKSYNSHGGDNVIKIVNNLIKESDKDVLMVR